jgi:hypothetical protein
MVLYGLAVIGVGSGLLPLINFGSKPPAAGWVF